MGTGGADTEDEDRRRGHRRRGPGGYGQRREAWEEPAPPPPHLGLRLPAARAVCTHACVYGGAELSSDTWLPR